MLTPPDRNSLLRCVEAIERSEMPAPDDLRYALHQFSHNIEWGKQMVAEGRGDEFCPIPGTRLKFSFMASVKYADLTTDLDELVNVMKSLYFIVPRGNSLYIYEPESWSLKLFEIQHWTMFELVKRAVTLKWERDT